MVPTDNVGRRSPPACRGETPADSTSGVCPTRPPPVPLAVRRLPRAPQGLRISGLSPAALANHVRPFGDRSPRQRREVGSWADQRAVNIGESRGVDVNAIGCAILCFTDVSLLIGRVSPVDSALILGHGVCFPVFTLHVTALITPWGATAHLRGGAPIGAHGGQSSLPRRAVGGAPRRIGLLSGQRRSAQPRAGPSPLARCWSSST